MSDETVIHLYYLPAEILDDLDKLLKLKEYGLETLDTLFMEQDKSIGKKLFKIESSVAGRYDKITELTVSGFETVQIADTKQDSVVFEQTDKVTGESIKRKVIRHAAYRRTLYFIDKTYAEMMICLMNEWSAVTDNIFDDHQAGVDIIDDYKTMYFNVLDKGV